MLTRLLALVAVLMPLAVPPGLAAADGCLPRGVSVSDATAEEGSAVAGGTLHFTVTTTGCAAGSVLYQTVVGGVAGVPAAMAGLDYVSTSGELAWPTGDPSTRTITVPVVGDNTVEPDEALTLLLYDPDGLATTDPVAAGMVLDDDATFRVALGKPHCDEFCVLCPLQVYTSVPAPTDLTFTVATRPGTATAGSDYATLRDVTLTIPAGASTASIAVTIHQDRIAEADETFFVVILGRSTDELARGQVTITDDD